MRKTSKHNPLAPAKNSQENIFATPAERVKLLRRGIPGTKIEKMYIETNSIFILDTDWQGSHETGAFFDTTYHSPQSRHVSNPVSPSPAELRT